MEGILASVRIRLRVRGVGPAVGWTETPAWASPARRGGPNVSIDRRNENSAACAGGPFDMRGNGNGSAGIVPTIVTQLAGVRDREVGSSSGGSSLLTDRRGRETGSASGSHEFYRSGFGPVQTVFRRRPE